ncbi:MAG TPA: universal stress protein, partial [Nocardioidaceae bacterium]|nr:universal stress protein [Nocardioidaceae bacterium]
MTSYFNVTAPLVVACIDGGDDGDRALRYATGEATRRGTGLRLVHVPMEFLPYAPVTPLYKMPNLHEVGASILKDALDRALELAPDLYVDGALATGGRVSAIVEESATAACVVVGTRAWRFYRTFGGSTSAGVAARAACPIIAVPPSWADVTGPGKVVVGVDSDGGPSVVLERGF